MKVWKVEQTCKHFCWSNLASCNKNKFKCRMHYFWQVI